MKMGHYKHTSKTTLILGLLILPFVLSFGCSKAEEPSKSQTSSSSASKVLQAEGREEQTKVNENEQAQEALSQAQKAVLSGQEIAGEIFGVPVPLGNYLFAQRIHSMFQRPEDKDMTPEQREAWYWENLIYHFEAVKRNIEVTDEEMDQWITSVLNVLEVDFNWKEVPEAYEAWINDVLKQDKELFENQMLYLAMIEKLKREMVNEMEVTVSEEEMKEEFMNIQNHVGGEYIIFETKEEAQEFYENNQTEKQWESNKIGDPDKIKPFSLITVQAIIDLWGVPEDIINEFHALPLGTTGKPMPFGRKWGVFRLLDKRTGDLAEFPEKEEEFRKRVEMKKKYIARNDWLEDLIVEANLKAYVTEAELIERQKKIMEQAQAS